MATTPSGTIYLIANAVVDRAYTHTIDFKNANEQFSFWRSLSKDVLTEYSYIRKQRQYIHIDKKLEELDAINYLMFRAREDGRLYYAFVVDKEYVTEDSSYVYFEIDAYQTFMFDFKFNPSYILQEHQDRWTADHKPIFSRTEENLEYGSEYTIESAYKVTPRADDIKWFIVTCVSHRDMIMSGHAEESSSISNAPSPYTYYLVPFINGESLRLEVKFIDGENTYTLNNLTWFFYFMARGSFGNFVKQINLLPYNYFNLSVEKDANGIYVVTNHETSSTLANTVITSVPYEAPSGNTAWVGHVSSMLKVTNLNIATPLELASMDMYEGLENALPTEKQWEDIKADPLNVERDRRFETKLLTHPYRYNLLTDWRNQPVTIKNEYLTKDKITLKLSTILSFLNSNRYFIEGYKKDIEGRGSSLIQDVPFEQPILSDAYYSYMLQNKNQISANRTNAIASAVTGSGNSIINGAIGGAMAGGPVGAVIGGVVSGFSSVMSGAVSVQNHIRSENAKQKDISNYPDTIINSSDCSMALADKNTYVTFYRYKICCEFEEQLSQYWHMYGYICKRVKVPDLRTRKRFNYIKTIGANITGSINQEYITTLRAIFDNGITIWHYSEKDFRPLNYTYENMENILL